MKCFITAIIFLFVTTTAYAGVEIGKAAPAFSEKDQNGKVRTLKEFKGKWVVLEWFNESCPYVVKHYNSGNMQVLQKKYTDKKVVWLSVATSAKGKQGYVAQSDAKDQMKRAKMASTALLLDADGSMGKAYDAKTTPHMFVINPEGKVAYAGAIDSNDSANPKTIAGAENFVVSALDSALKGKTIAKNSTKPYGCSVKY